MPQTRLLSPCVRQKITCDSTLEFMVVLQLLTRFVCSYILTYGMYMYIHVHVLVYMFSLNVIIIVLRYTCTCTCIAKNCIYMYLQYSSTVYLYNADTNVECECGVCVCINQYLSIIIKLTSLLFIDFRKSYTLI